MSRFIDLTGKKFGKLLVIKRVENYIQPSGAIKARFLCKCDCGKETIVDTSRLKSGNTKSCGCYKIEKTKEIKTKHGLKNTSIYAVWQAMKKRCYKKNNRAYKNYGGRGITICNEWKDNFLEFYNWAVSNGYKKGLTIDRIDNNKGYYPNNCRWADYKKQGRNTRKNHILELNGEKHCISEWAEILCISQRKIYDRLNKGWAIDKVLSKKRYETIR